MESPSFGARGRNRAPLHLVSSRDATPIGATLRHIRRSPQARANRRDWWMCWVIVPALLLIGTVLLVLSAWRVQ